MLKLLLVCRLRTLAAREFAAQAATLSDVEEALGSRVENEPPFDEQAARDADFAAVRAIVERRRQQ